MNFKRILVIVMTFAMLLSTFAPTLGVFADYINDDTHSHSQSTESTSKDKHYVSIGDSMTNGYGFEGYEQGKTNPNNHMSFDRFVKGDGVYGAGSYALQFEDYLNSKGYDVTHTKLAVSALRAEDLLYLLGGREAPADDWFDQVLNYSTGSTSNRHLVPQLAAHYQNAVKNADVISLGVGNASFGAFFLSRVTAMLGVMGGSLSDEQKAMYTLENALKIVESEEERQMVLALYDEVYATIRSNVSDEIATQYNLEGVCGLLAYTAAAFIYNYAKSIDKIVELNPDVEIILVGLMNTTYGMTVDLGDGEKFYFGDAMDEVFRFLNDYIVLYPTLKQAEGKLQGAKFHYAEQPQPKFIVQAFDDLAHAGWTNVDCGDEDCGTEGHDCEGNGRLSADIVRARTITTYNDSLRPMISAGFVSGINAGIEATVRSEVLNGFRDAFGVPSGAMNDEEFIELLKTSGQYENYEATVAQNMVGRPLTNYYGFLPEITLADVKAYEANVPAAWNNQYFFMDASDVKNLAVAVYLGIEDAIIESVKVDEIPLEGLITIAGDITKVFDGFAPSTNSPEDVHADLANFFSSDDIVPLVKIYAIFKIGDGMSVHPTPAGHDDLAEVVIEAYNVKEGIPAEVVLERMHHVYVTAADFGILSEIPELAILEEVYEKLDAHKHITDEQTLDILLYTYNCVADGEITSKELANVADYAYKTIIRNPLLTNAERVEIIAEIYTVLKDNGYFNEYQAVEVAEEIYRALKAEKLLSDNQTMNVVEYVYGVIADGEVTEEEFVDIVIYAYYVVIKNEAPVARQLRARAAANTNAESAKTLKIILGIVAENYFSEENKASLETLVTGEEALINDDLLVKIVENVVNDVENNESDNAALLEKVSETVLKTVAEDPNTSIATKAEIVQEVAKVVENNASTGDAPVIDDATTVETIKQIVAAVSEENFDEKTQASVNKLLLDENALISDALLLKVVENVYSEFTNADTDDLAGLIENVSKVVVKTVLEDPDTDEATKAAIANEVFNVLGNSGILGDQGSDAYFEVRRLAGKIYRNLEAKGLMSETELRLIVAAVVTPLLYDEKLSVKDASNLLFELNEIVFGRDDLTFRQKLDIFVVVYDTLYEEGYITEENAQLVLDFVLEYYDDAYAYGYDYLDKNGYIEDAIVVLDKVIARLELVDLSDNGDLINEFRAELEAEIEELIKSLTKIRNVLANGDISTADGFIAVLLASGDDVLRHLANIYAIAEKAGIYVNENFIIPALEEALFILETEVLPALEKLVNEFVDAVVEVLTEAYNTAMAISKEVYVQIVTLIVKVQIFAGDVAEVVLNQYIALVDLLTEIYGDATVAYNKALEVIGALVEKALEVKENVEEAIEIAVITFNELFKELNKVLNDTELALDTAEKIVSYIIYRVNDVVTDVNDIAELTNDIVTLVYEILVDAGVPVEEAMEIAAKVAGAVLDVVLEEMGGKEAVLEAVNGLLDNALELLLNSGLTYEEALTISASAFVTVVVAVVRHFDDIDNALDLTKEALQTVYDYLVENRVEITEALKMVVDTTKAIVEAILEGIEDAKNLNKAVEELLKTVYEFFLEAGLTAEEALKAALEIFKTVLEDLAKEAKEQLAQIVAGMLGAAYDLLIEAGLNAQEALEKAMDALVAILADLTEEAKEQLEVLVKLVLEAAYDLLIEAGLTAEEALKNLAECAGAMLEKAIGDLLEAGLTVKEALDRVTDIAKAVTEFLTEKAEDIKAALEFTAVVFKTVYEFLIEAGVDVKEALAIAAEIVKEVVKFVIENAENIENALAIAKDVFATVYNFLVENGEELQAAFEMAVEVFTELVEFIIAHTDDIEAAIKIAVEAYEFVLEAAKLVCGTVEDIYALAAKVYATLVEVSVKIHCVVDTTINVYNFVYDLLVDVFGSVENAAKVAIKIANLIVEFVKNSPELLDAANKLYVDIYNIIVEVYGETGDPVKVAEAIYRYAIGVWAAIKAEVAELIYNASNGNYVITEDSYYVALGSAEYAEELANKLFLGNKYGQFGLTDNYLEALAKADLVTVKFNNGEMLAFAHAQAMGTLANIIREHQNLMGFYEMLTIAGVTGYVEEALGFSLDAQVVELEWSKYMDAETEQLLKNTLADIKVELIANGMPEYVDIAPMLNEVIGSIVPLGLVGTVDVAVADLVVFAIESALYAYAELVDRIETTLETVYAVAPNATVVITGMSNPLESLVPMLDAYSDYIGNTAQYIGYLDVLADIMNVHLYAEAFVRENTVFVNSDNAEDIYAALHARCAHAYDDCADAICNICGEERVAPGHVYDNACDADCNVCGATRTPADHVYDNACDATCNVCGATRTPADHVYDNACDADCNVCGAIRIPADHVYDNACDADCNVCGATRTPADHVYDDKYDATCNVCGYVREVPMRPIVIIAIVIGCVAGVCGIGALGYWLFNKYRKRVA